MEIIRALNLVALAVLALFVTAILGACATAEAPPAAREELQQPRAEPAYAPADVLARLRANAGTREWDTMGKGPIGLDRALVDRRIADLIAANLYTVDGRPYPDLWIEGGCLDRGDEVLRCPARVGAVRVHIFGVTEDDPERPRRVDIQILEMDVPTETVRLPDGAETRQGIPDALRAELEVAARSLSGGIVPGTAGLDGARWLLPPAEGQFDVQFSEGGDFWVVRLEPRPPVLVRISREPVLQARLP